MATSTTTATSAPPTTPVASPAVNDRRAVQADDGRAVRAMQTEQAASLRQRYRVTTASAAALGATGVALVVTGVVLLATGGRRPRVAVAPWGARGVGGLVLKGRF